MNKGFTLAELIAVIVILSLISLITIPAISKTLKDNKKTLCKNQLEQILITARSYGAENIFSLPQADGGTKTITLQTLISEGFIDGDIENPLTKDNFDTDMEIKIVKKGKKYEYKFEDETYALCETD